LCALSYRCLKPIKITVWFKIQFEETDLRNKVKAAGGKWLTEHKVWVLGYDVAKNLRLKNRVVKRINNNVQI